ncbi:unnamed protein product [Hymenolepis diminuta]|uniref:Uncharacterized protein n=1 Tax=Hymenolepis diminuta TaxID=6216 RepID=A0A564Z540_HYMDI|nr:unnamed protein product [Hymenolepis diminuta]
MDPADLTHEKMISKLGSVVGDVVISKGLTISEDENVHYYVGIFNRLCASFQKLIQRSHFYSWSSISLSCLDSIQTHVPLR